MKVTYVIRLSRLLWSIILVMHLGEGIRHVESMRRKSESHRSIELTSAKPGEKPEMRIFSATFNAANNVYSDAAQGLTTMSTIIQGHEDSDIVILNLQEYLDDCRSRQGF